MIRVKFNDSNAFQTAEFSMNGDRVILTGEVPEDTSGFKVYRLNGSELGDYSDYTNCTKLEDGCEYGRGE